MSIPTTVSEAITAALALMASQVPGEEPLTSLQFEGLMRATHLCTDLMCDVYRAIRHLGLNSQERKQQQRPCVDNWFASRTRNQQVNDLARVALLSQMQPVGILLLRLRKPHAEGEETTGEGQTGSSRTYLH